MSIAIGLHILIVLGLREWMRVQTSMPVAAAVETVMELRLIDVPVAQQPPPSAPTAPMPTSQQVPVATRNPTSAAASAAAAVAQTLSSMTAAAPEEADAPSDVRLFRSDGSVFLPIEQGDPDPAAFGSRRKDAPFAVNPMTHRSPLPYTPTMFERDWDPHDDELMPLEWLKSAMVEKSWRKSWDTRGGTRITCEFLLILGGCGWGPSPRVTIEELKRMRADPPMRRLPSTVGEEQPERTQ